MSSGTRMAVVAVFLLATCGASGQVKLESAPPKGSELGRVSAPLVYEKLMLVLATADGVTAIVFTDKVENGVGYKFRYESADGKKRETGTAKLFEKYKRLPGRKAGEVEVVDDGGELWFKGGSYEVEWSLGPEGRGWIYYYPEKVRVQIATSDEFDKIDLKRFAK